MASIKLNELVTASEMTKILGISRVTFQVWRDSGYIPFYIVGKSKKYHPVEVEQELLKNKVSAN